MSDVPVATNQTVNTSQLQVKRTQSFKLKDRPNRGGIMFDLEKTFGFIPEKIIIQKVAGSNNTFILSAVKTDDMIKFEQEQEQKMAEKVASESETPSITPQPQEEVKVQE